MLRLVDSSPTGAELPLPLERVLCSRLTGFVSFLRENGFAVGLDDAALLVDSAVRVGILDKQLVKWMGRALLCRRADDLHRFEELFNAWFLPPNRSQLVERRAGGGAGQLNFDQVGASADEGMPVATTTTATESVQSLGSSAKHGASDTESLSHTDFRHLHQPDDLRSLDILMRSFAARLRKLILRRERAGGTSRINMPGTVRRSIRHGGEPIELVFRQRRRIPPRLILLLDVSRSMNMYSFFFLRLARALAGVRLDSHVFIWHTKLLPVSEAIRDPDPWRAQERLQLLSLGWGGGTRIGECLSQFEREHASLVHARTAIIIVSDGYDTGEPSLLVTALKRLRRRARRLVWLNPLAGKDGYQPTASGMSAALPYLDLLAPAHDFASIKLVLPSIVQALH